jgi:hypothetical protein
MALISSPEGQNLRLEGGVQWAGHGGEQAMAPHTGHRVLQHMLHGD